MLEVTDDSGFLALIDPAAYVGFVADEWELDQLVRHFREEMGQRRLLIWGTGLEGFWRVEVSTAPVTAAAFREVCGPITVTSGGLRLASYEDLTMAAALGVVSPVGEDEEDLLIPLAPGTYDCRILQLFDPERDSFADGDGPDFVIEILPGADTTSPWEQIPWSDLGVDGSAAAPARQTLHGGASEKASAGATAPEPELVLFYDLPYRVANGLSPAALLLAAVMLLALSVFTDRPDLAAGYRWGAVVITAIAAPWTIAWWRRLARPALRATGEGLVLDDGRVLAWDLFAKAVLTKIEDEEWMGFRFRRGVARTLDAATRELLRGQDGWLAAGLAGAFPTNSITVTRSQAIEGLVSLSRLPVTGGETAAARD